MSKKKSKPSAAPSLPIQRVPIFDEAFREDIAWWFKMDRAKANKVLDLISEVMRSPFEGIGKPEPLKHNLKGYWSKRINDEHRMVYKVTEDFIFIAQCRKHYED